MKVALVILVLLLIFAGFSFDALLGKAVYKTPMETGFVEVYICPQDDCRQAYLSHLNNVDSVKCAFYDVKDSSILDVLRTKNADVLVHEENYKSDLHDGFKVVSTPNLMHNKFCILDENIVITGSTNPTNNGLDKNFNNLVVIQSNYLARNYLQEFEEIKSQRTRQNVKHNPTVYKYIAHNDYLIENYFCPEDNCEKHVLEELSKAQESVRVMAFSFTSDAIGEMLVSLSERIDVSVLMENRQLNDYSEYNTLLSGGVPTRLRESDGLLHHKVFIIDESTVILGSYNPTKNGNERNDENIVIIHDRELTWPFVEEFFRLWDYGDIEWDYHPWAEG